MSRINVYAPYPLQGIGVNRIVGQWREGEVDHTGLSVLLAGELVAGLDLGHLGDLLKQRDTEDLRVLILRLWCEACERVSALAGEKCTRVWLFEF